MLNSPSELAIVTGVNTLIGRAAARSTTGAAPMANAAADASAACIGRARVPSDRPSSSRAWAPSASWAISSSATSAARLRAEATRLVDTGQLGELALRELASSARSRARSARSVSAWELTETYSPAAIESAPATRPASAGDEDGVRASAAAATPTTRLLVEISPSLAPSTAARSHPMP